MQLIISQRTTKSDNYIVDSNALQWLPTHTVHQVDLHKEFNRCTVAANVLVTNNLCLPSPSFGNNILANTSLRRDCNARTKQNLNLIAWLHFDAITSTIESDRQSIWPCNTKQSTPLCVGWKPCVASLLACDENESRFKNLDKEKFEKSFVDAKMLSKIPFKMVFMKIKKIESFWVRSRFSFQSLWIKPFETDLILFRRYTCLPVINKEKNPPPPKICFVIGDSWIRNQWTVEIYTQWWHTYYDQETTVDASKKLVCLKM